MTVKDDDDVTLVAKITKEELEYLMAKRKKDAHDAKRQGYIDEMNDLLMRAKQDGFVFGVKGSHLHVLDKD